MKKTLFVLIVIAAGIYLASQTDSGQALVKGYLPKQKIDQAAEQLLQQVESRIQDFADQQADKQQEKLTKLELRIVQLEQQKPNANILTNQPASEVVVQTKESELPVEIAPEVPVYSTFSKQPADNIQLQAKKQALLQDIASRMELVSVQAINSQ